MDTQEYKVLIPEESYSLYEFQDNNLPGIAILNTSLKDFEPHEVFDWHLSLILDLVNVDGSGLPDLDEQEELNLIEDKLDSLIKGDNLDKPNALFFARITWDKTRQLIWRVCDPKIANITLQDIIANKKYTRDFDYRMEQDLNWEHVRCYFQ